MNRQNAAMIAVILALGFLMTLGPIAPLTLGQTVEDKKAQADRFLQDGLVEYNRGHFFQAISCFEHALLLYREIGNAWGEADCLGNLGLCYKAQASYERAISYHERSLRICQETGYRLGEANCLANIGLCRHLLAEDQQAVDSLSQALLIFSELRNRRNEASTLLQLSISYRVLGEYERAQECDEQALIIFRALDDPSGEARSLNSLGNDAYRVGDYEVAIALYERAYDLFHETSDYRGMAASLGNMGGCYEVCGEYERAIECYEAAASVVQLTFYSAVSAQSMATSLNNLGVCHFRLANYTRAIRYHEEALLRFQEIDDRRGEAKALANMANCYHVLGVYTVALQLYMETWITFQDIGDRGSEATSLNALGMFYKEEGEYQTAIDFYERALVIEGELGDSRGETLSLLGLGLCYEALARYEQAIEAYEGSVTLAREIEAAEESWYGLWGLGRAHWRSGHLEDAQATFEQAIAAVELVRSLIHGEPFRQTFFSKAQRLYEEYLDLLLDSGKPEATLDIAERCRARTFLDLLAAGPIGTLENVVEKGIRSGVVEVSAIGTDLAEIVVDLPTDTAALEYFVAEKATYLWLIRDGLASDPIRIETSRAELRKQVLAFRTTIETTSTKMSETPDPEEGMEEMSRDLYELLIAPVEDRLEGIEHLVIVPSGPLYYLPFCALMNCPDCEGPDLLGGEYLIERYTLSYTPSLTTLKYVWASSEAIQANPLFLALADPDSGDPQFSRLPGAQDEAVAIADLFDPSEVYVDSAATEDVIIERTHPASQILLSTHGVFNPHNPMFSYLLLSPSDGSDGRLYTHEIFGLDLHTDLVTLSACETLLPALAEMEEDVRAVRGTPVEEDVELTDDLLETLTAGDEIVGLTRAFLYAGTPSVLSSLWSVVSETTEPLMVAFYGYLKTSLSKADALRQAQLDVMASYPHPRYWAAFELVGDWR